MICMNTRFPWKQTSIPHLVSNTAYLSLLLWRVTQMQGTATAISFSSIVLAAAEIH